MTIQQSRWVARALDRSPESAVDLSNIGTGVVGVLPTGLTMN